MTIQNTGSSSWTLQSAAQVNSVTGLPVKSIGNGGATNLNCTNGKSISISITTTCTSGNAYYVTLLLTDGTKITYEANAP
jgi:hypothetical protein